MTASLDPLARIPPFVVRDDLLSADDLRELTAFALSNEAAFRPTSIGAKVGEGRVDTAWRTSRVMDDAVLESWRGRIGAAIAPVLLNLLRPLGIKPFEIARYEIELVRHNDGDFYRRHIDTGRDTGTVGQRVVSMVYYFHAEPKVFTGGALRFYSLASDQRFVDVDPTQNRLVAFPSWAPHEVMPVSCPSRRFEDSRFAINCWARMIVPDRPATSLAQS